MRNELARQQPVELRDVTPARGPAAPNTDTRTMARFGLGALGLGLGGFLLWACLAPLDQGVVGDGTVAVSGERKAVQALSGGMIDSILVREGQAVRQGELLVQFNTLQAQTQLDIALGQWIVARSSEARLIAERLDRDHIEWPDDLLARADDRRAKAAMELQHNLFATRRAELQSRLDMAGHEVGALEEQLRGYEKVRSSNEAQLASLEEELQGMRELAKEGYLPRNRLFETERNQAQIASQLASSIADVGRTRQSINEARLKRAQQVQQFRSEAESDLAKVSADVSSYGEQVRSLTFEVEHAAVASPADGQVIGLDVHTVGGVVPPGQKLMEIVPLGSPWVVKAQFPPLMADRLKPGLPVEVRFTSLHRVTTPVVEGQVLTVSADQLVDERTQQPYFAVEVEVGPQAVAELQEGGIKVKPGMQAEVIVRTGERTLMNYLLKPLRERLAAAFKEE